MRSTQHPTNNRVLGAPAGWDQSGPLPCSALAITDNEWDGVPAVASFWRPTPEELQALNDGGLVVLNIIGRTMPPASVYVAPSA